MDFMEDGTMTLKLRTEQGTCESSTCEEIRQTETSHSETARKWLQDRADHSLEEMAIREILEEDGPGSLMDDIRLAGRETLPLRNSRREPMGIRLRGRSSR
jgi:hypothetical protein